MSSMLYQIFWPLYAGNEIQNESRRLLHSLYQSNWMDADLRTKKLIIIAMENLKKPIVIVAVSTFSIDLNHFLSVSLHILCLLILELNICFLGHQNALLGD